MRIVTENFPLVVGAPCQSPSEQDESSDCETTMGYTCRGCIMSIPPVRVVESEVGATPSLKNRKRCAWSLGCLLLQKEVSASGVHADGAGKTEGRLPYFPSWLWTATPSHKSPLGAAMPRPGCARPARSPVGTWSAVALCSGTCG